MGFECLFGDQWTDAQKSDLEGLVALWRRLRTEVERKHASPAMQLLDELLMIVSPFDDASEATDEERYKNLFKTLGQHSLREMCVFRGYWP